MEQTKSAFEVYNDMYKIWGDVFNSWTKSMTTSGIPVFTTAESGNWFIPFQQYYGEWNNIYEGFAQMMKTLPWPYEMLNKQTHTFMQGISSTVGIYDSWMQNIDKIGRKQAELTQDIFTGKEVSMDPLFESIRVSYNEISNSVVKSLKGTFFEGAFDGIEDINKAIEKFIDSFPEEQQQAKEVLQSFCNGYIKVISSWTESMAGASRTFTDMLAKGEISSEALTSVLNTYGEAAKEAVCNVLSPLPAFIPEYSATADNLMNWANKYFDLLGSWIGVPLKLFQGIGKTYADMTRLTSETFNKEEAVSSQDFFDAWNKSYQQLAADLINNSQFINSVPKFTANLTEYIKASNNLYHHFTNPPFPSKEEYKKVCDTLEELKDMVGKKKGGNIKSSKSKEDT